MSLEVVKWVIKLLQGLNGVYCTQSQMEDEEFPEKWPPAHSTKTLKQSLQHNSILQLYTLNIVLFVFFSVPILSPCILGSVFNSPFLSDRVPARHRTSSFLCRDLTAVFHPRWRSQSVALAREESSRLSVNPFSLNFYSKLFLFDKLFSSLFCVLWLFYSKKYFFLFVSLSLSVLNFSL